MMKKMAALAVLLLSPIAHSADPASLQPDRSFNFCLASGVLYSTAAAESLGMTGIMAGAQDAIDKLQITKLQLKSILSMYRENPTQAHNDAQVILSGGSQQPLMQFASMCTHNPSRYVPNYSSLKKSGLILD